MRGPNASGEPAFGLVTALPVECGAVRASVDATATHRVAGDPNHYVTGTMPSSVPGHPHQVVVALQTQDGTRNASAICTDMARSFPQLRTFIMCGIAAGVPGYADPLPVRPGDLVVATKGIVDYAHVRAVDGTATLRRQVNGLSAMLLRADRELQVDAEQGGERWLTELSALSERNPRLIRPGNSEGEVTVHRGAIGSADVLLRDAVLRDDLAARYDLCAFEMEGSGVAVGADLHERRWFMIRGISDTGDAAKDDTWHGYAAAMAATYVRALLKVCSPMGTAPLPTTDANGLETIVNALLELRLFRDGNQRREVIDQLPDYISDAVTDHHAARLHVVALVRTCEQYEEQGRDALIGALRMTLGPQSPKFRRLSEIITTNWTSRA